MDEMKLTRLRAALISVTSVVAASVALTALPASAITDNEGYDFSWPQCAGPTSSHITNLPAPGATNVIGVDGGKIFAKNNCLVDLLKWAKSKPIQLYANTGNPGPTVYSPSGRVASQISGWPIPSRDRDNSNRPKPCTDKAPDSVNCAYDYGYKGAKASYAHAVAAFRAAGIGYSPAAVNWWLDLESSNTWRGHDSEFPEPRRTGLRQANLDVRNRASMLGARDYLIKVAKVKQVGLYGSPNEWAMIMNTTTLFANSPYWFPIGGATSADALAACSDTRNVTGSGLPVMVQYQVAGVDINQQCFPPTSVTYEGGTSVAVRSPLRLKATVTGGNAQPLYGVRVYFVLNAKTYSAVTNALGVAWVRVVSPSVIGSYPLTATLFTNSYTGSSTTSAVDVH